MVLASTSGASRRNCGPPLSGRARTLEESLTWMALVTFVQETKGPRVEVPCTSIPAPLDDDQDRIARPLAASMFRAGACGGMVTRTETGAEIVVAPALSAATAVRT